MFVTGVVIGPNRQLTRKVLAASTCADLAISTVETSKSTGMLLVAAIADSAPRCSSRAQMTRRTIPPLTTSCFLFMFFLLFLLTAYFNKYGRAVMRQQGRAHLDSKQHIRRRCIPQLPGARLRCVDTERAH